MIDYPDDLFFVDPGETDRVLGSAIATVMGAAASLPERESLSFELSAIREASARGYFLPDEEEWIKLRYSQYLSLRASLLSTIEEIGALAGSNGLAWESRLPLFATAFSAACILMRANRFLVDIAADCSVVWKKLDEADLASGIPRKSFTGIYHAISSPRNQLRFLDAADFFIHHRDEIRALSDNAALRPIVDQLEIEAPFIELRRREAIKRHISYRWFSFLRRHRSAWKQVMNGMFEFSGRAIADLRQPGIKPSGSAKRITPSLQADVLALARPGDVIITRHDDALSNLFLPGFWPHGALYLGRSPDLPENCDDLPLPDASDAWFLEAKKDGVKIRPAGETMAVDALVILRSPLSETAVRQAIQRSLSHRGKSYDFLFDFRAADRLVCTEVLYRGFHGIDPVRFQLREVGGRLCLSAEEFLNQALACGFEIILTAGIAGSGLLVGQSADTAFHSHKSH